MTTNTNDEIQIKNVLELIKSSNSTNVNCNEMQKKILNLDIKNQTCHWTSFEKRVFQDEKNNHKTMKPIIALEMP